MLCLYNFISRSVFSRTIADATNARTQGVEMFVVGATSFVNIYEVRQMSSAPQRENVTYWLSPTFQNLNGVVNMVQDELCAGKHGA